PVRTAIEGALSNERRRSPSGSSHVRTIVADRLARYERFWSPDKSIENWTVEMLADVISTWTCGPAFLAAFKEDMEHAKRPLETHDTHPPLYLRATSLIELGEILGWDEYLGSLRELVREWRYSAMKGGAQNDYAAMV